MPKLLKVYFFTDIYGLKFCVQVLHWDLHSPGILHAMYCKLAIHVSGQTYGLVFKGQAE